MALGRLSKRDLESLKRRFAQYWRRDPATGCHVWTGTPRSQYGMIGVGSRKKGTCRTLAAHRVAWELRHGPIPRGMTIDHRRCRNKRCVNPRHMVLCTRAQNARQPDGVAGLHLARTHCPHGHPYSGDNLRRSAYGRICLACRRRSEGYKGGLPFGQRTHCPQGHPYDAENTRIYQGRRFCRQCHRDRGRARYHSKSRA